MDALQVRIEVAELEAFALRDAERINVFLYAIENLSSRHSATPFFAEQSSVSSLGCARSGVSRATLNRIDLGRKGQQLRTKL